MYELPKPDNDLTIEQKEKVALLSSAELTEIDTALLSNSKQQWRKVAMVVGLTMKKIPNRVYGIPDVFYSQRIYSLIKRGKLESQGNLKYMGFSEVRLPCIN